MKKHAEGELRRNRAGVREVCSRRQRTCWDRGSRTQTMLGDTSECLTLTLSREVNEKNRALHAGNWHSTNIRKISIQQRRYSNFNLQQVNS